MGCGLSITLSASVRAHQLEGDGAWNIAAVHGRTAAEIARCQHHSPAFQPPAELRLPAAPPTVHDIPLSNVRQFSVVVTAIIPHHVEFDMWL